MENLGRVSGEITHYHWTDYSPDSVDKPTTYDLMTPEPGSYQTANIFLYHS